MEITPLVETTLLVVEIIHLVDLILLVLVPPLLLKITAVDTMVGFSLFFFAVLFLIVLHSHLYYLQGGNGFWGGMATGGLLGYLWGRPRNYGGYRGGYGGFGSSYGGFGSSYGGYGRFGSGPSSAFFFSLFSQKKKINLLFHRPMGGGMSMGSSSSSSSSSGSRTASGYGGSRRR